MKGLPCKSCRYSRHRGAMCPGSRLPLHPEKLPGHNAGLVQLFTEGEGGIFGVEADIVLETEDHHLDLVPVTGQVGVMIQKITGCRLDCLDVRFFVTILADYGIPITFYGGSRGLFALTREVGGGTGEILFPLGYPVVNFLGLLP